LDGQKYRLGVREEGPAVNGEFRCAPATGEQWNAEELFEGGDPLRHGLLGDAEFRATS
jgi:hypothetical protein